MQFCLRRPGRSVSWFSGACDFSALFRGRSYHHTGIPCSWCRTWDENVNVEWNVAHNHNSMHRLLAFLYSDFWYETYVFEFELLHTNIGYGARSTLHTDQKVSCKTSRQIHYENGVVATCETQGGRRSVEQEELSRRRLVWIKTFWDAYFPLKARFRNSCAILSYPFSLLLKWFLKIIYWKQRPYFDGFANVSFATRNIALVQIMIMWEQ